MSILVEPVDYAVMSDANRKAQAEISHLTKEFEEVNRRYDAIEKLYASARLDLMVEQQLSEKLRADLEIALAKVERYEKRDEATAWLPSQAEEIIQLRRELLQSQNELNALKQRVKFLPGDRVWVLDSYGEIRNVFIESMSNGNYVTVNLSGNRTQFHQNSCFATAEECRAAIRIVPIEEKGE